jgi:hypothetical protein
MSSRRLSCARDDVAFDEHMLIVTLTTTEFVPPIGIRRCAMLAEIARTGA